MNFLVLICTLVNIFRYTIEKRFIEHSIVYLQKKTFKILYLTFQSIVIFLNNFCENLSFTINLLRKWAAC